MPLKQEGKRQLAAIMFTDIVGYTALMGHDEKRALELLKRNREIHRRHIEEYHGQWIKELGDGVLASFNTVTDAVLCGHEILHSARNTEGLALRIGIHLGEIIFENNDVFGDGVNVASRLHALASPGQICVSEDVHKIAGNKQEFSSRFLGEEYLKNVNDPVKIYEVTVSDDAHARSESNKARTHRRTSQISLISKPALWITGIVIGTALLALVYAKRTTWFSQGTTDILEKSIAVLPFVNMSEDSEQEYFSDGISEEIINVLAQARDLKVISRTSSFQFKGKNVDLRTIGANLGVATVLEGSVRKSNDKIRITAQLIRTSDGTHIWSKTFDRMDSDIFGTQEEIAVSVFTSLKASLSLEELSHASTQNFAAYDLFLKARAENRKFHMDPSFLHRSMQLLEEALQIDPDFPEALTLLAFNRVDLTWTEGLDPRAEGAKAREELHKAIELNPYSSDTYIVLGTVNFYLDWNLPEAQKNFEKGWALSNYGGAPISQCFCGYLGFILGKGDFKNALSVLHTVEKIDPNYPFGVVEKLMAYRSLQDSLSLKALISDTSRFAPFEPTYYYELGNYEAAVNSFLKNNTDFVWPTTYLASAYFKAGMPEKSDSLIHQMIQRSKHEQNLDFGLAIIYAARGEKEEAIRWFKSAYVKNDFWLVTAKADVDLKLIIDEPEVKEILDKIGL